MADELDNKKKGAAWTIKEAKAKQEILITGDAIKSLTDSILKTSKLISDEDISRVKATKNLAKELQTSYSGAKQYLAVQEKEKSIAEQLLANKKELALLNNKAYITQAKRSALNDLAHANSKAALAHMDEIDLLEDESYKRLEKAKILNDAHAKSLKDELDLTKQLDLLNDEGLTKAKLAQTIFADRLSTADAIAKLTSPQEELH